MYTILITYDTGDTFHYVHGATETIRVQWEDSAKAKAAKKDIDAHYHYYMILNKEWNAGKKEKDDATKFAKKQKWYSGNEYPFYNVLLEGDDGKRVSEYLFWTGYFESLVSTDVVDVDNIHSWPKHDFYEERYNDNPFGD